MNLVVIGIGSNIEPMENIQQARQFISTNHKIIKESSYVETRPIGIQNQANFINGVMLIETEFNIKGLKVELRQIENKLGRDRSLPKFGPRTIDLDIVIWNSKIIDKDIYNREFLKNAVLQVLPDFKI